MGNFGLELLRFRVRYEVSQAKLARLAGFDHSYISRLESGKRRPTREALEAFVKAVKAKPEDRDTLFIAAGFLPSELSSLFPYPVLGSIGEALDALPEPLRENGIAALETLWLGLCAMGTLAEQKIV